MINLQNIDRIFLLSKQQNRGFVVDNMVLQVTKITCKFFKKEEQICPRLLNV